MAFTCIGVISIIVPQTAIPVSRPILVIILCERFLFSRCVFKAFASNHLYRRPIATQNEYTESLL